MPERERERKSDSVRLEQAAEREPQANQPPSVHYTHSRFCGIPTSLFMNRGSKKQAMESQVSRCKIVVVGDAQCGKTTLLHVFAKDCYPEVGVILFNIYHYFARCIVII